MEGTSGAAERVSFREEAQEAALPESTAKAALRGEHSNSFACSKARSVSKTGFSLRPRIARATWGVRADRVGAKLASQAIATRGACSRRLRREHSRPLARESSAPLVMTIPLRRKLQWVMHGGSVSSRRIGASRYRRLPSSSRERIRRSWRTRSSRLAGEDRVSGSEGRACGSFDCRSRRAARGRSARGREERPMRLGSSRSLPRSWPVKERRKPGHGRRSSGTGGGLAFEVGRRESGGGPSGHSSMEGASERSTSKPLTGLRQRRSFQVSSAQAEAS